MSIESREIEQITQRVFKSMFGWDVLPIHHSKPSMDAPRIGSWVRVTGTLQGEMAVMCSVVLAQRAAEVLFTGSHTHRGEQGMYEAVRKIAGQVGSSLTSAVARSRIDELSPAMICGGGMGRTSQPSIVFECHGEPCWVLVDAVAVGCDTSHAVQKRNRFRTRGFERVDVDLNITVHAGRQCLHATHATDLSMNGVFVECDALLPKGTNCDVVVHRGDREGVRVSGRVVRNTSDGFAIEFLEVDLDSYGRLRDVVRANSEPIAARELKRVN